MAFFHPQMSLQKVDTKILDSNTANGYHESMVYEEFRCGTCKKLLFKGILVDSAVEVKCKKCGVTTKFNGADSQKLVCHVFPCPGRRTLSNETVFEGT